MIGTAVKLVLFIVAVLSSYPAGRWLRERPALRHLTWTLIGFLPFYDAPDSSLYFFESIPGDTHGLEVAVIDWLVVSLCFAYPGSARPLPYRIPLAVYLLVVLASATQAQWMVLSLGYAWKLGRMYLLFAAVWRAGDDRRVPAAILRGMTLGLVYEGVLVLWQHYGLGLFQAPGSFAHQNELAVLANIAVMAPLALILAGPTPLLTKLAPVAAVAGALFTVSRGAMLFLGTGSALVFLGSAFRRYTVRKAWICMIGLVLGAAFVPLALSTIESRKAEERAESIEHRQRLEVAASLMLQEHPLGIGPNCFMSQLIHGGYGERSGLSWRQRVSIVHNIYLLTAAEMGYAGVVALVILFLVPLASALWYGLRARHDRRGDVLLGLGVGLIAFYAHGFFEWVWRLTGVSYVYFTIIGIVAVLTRQIKDDMAGRSRAYRMVGERQAVRLGQPVRGTAGPDGFVSSVADLKSPSSLRASRRTS